MKEHIEFQEDYSNLIMQLGEGNHNFQMHLRVPKTLLNRIKFWCFFCVFPFRLISWK